MSPLGAGVLCAGTAAEFPGRAIAGTPEVFHQRESLIVFGQELERPDFVLPCTDIPGVGFGIPGLTGQDVILSMDHHFLECAE